MRFGFELEVRSNASAVLANLRSMGVATHDGFHQYHCRCSRCDYGAEPGKLFIAQNDCTVDGELISVILEHGSRQHYRAVRAISRAMLLAQASTDGETGLHVHVENAPFPLHNGRPGRAHRIMYRLMRRYGESLRELAAGSHNDVRPYNGYPEHWESRYESTPFDWSSNRVPSCGSWLVAKEHTNEFRLWNSTRVEWRLNLAIGLSVAMATAALAHADTIGPDDVRPIESILAPYLDPITFAAVLRQRYAKGGVTS